MVAAMVRLPLASVRLDDKCQPRVVTDLNLAKEYAEALVDGAIFPPVVVFYDGTEHWLADGFHRWYGHEMASVPDILADVRAGDRRDAILHSVSANAEHGWRRSNEDKRRAVDALLDDPEWSQWSDREISRRCGVDHMVVARRRPAPLSGAQRQIASERPDVRKATRNGTDYTVSTGGINAGRLREVDPDREYTIRDDPRQLDIEAALREAPEPPGFDTDAADIRLPIANLVAMVTDTKWPTPEQAMKAWMVGRGYSVTVEQVRRAVNWLADFADLFAEQEPKRLLIVEDLLERSRKHLNGTL